MKIKKLDAFGFKSFKERVSFPFEPGITAIVGPNGCGKSNIVDAIRWVMGEQNPRSLRGEVMEDIIFGGSENENPLGMAEVNLFFSNDNNGVFPAGYSEYNEIMISRRLFRSGESEFCINKVPCRLKDIRELFMDTGLGKRAYSIIEQGEVDKFINYKPEDKRYLIEEAAGISKYKSRKDTSLRKIESTHQHLLRIKDIIFEVKRQTEKLNRQVEKAEHYKSIKKEIKEIEINLAANKFWGLRNKKSEFLVSIKDFENKKENISHQLEIKEANIEEEKLDLLYKEKELGKLQEELTGSHDSLVKTENQVQNYSDQFERLEKLAKKDGKEYQELKTRWEETGKKEKSIKEERKNLENKLTMKKEETGKKDLIVKEVTDIFHSLSARLEKEKDSLVNISTKETRYLDTLSNLSRHCEALKLKLVKNSDDKEDIISEIYQSKEQCLILESELNIAKQQKTALEKNQVRDEGKLKVLRGSLAAQDKTLLSLRETFSKKRSRLHSLRELEESFEWYQAGIRSLMLNKKSGNGKANGVLGLVADIVETTPQYEPVVEAVLGEKLQYVIVGNQESGIEAIEFLKKKSLGRSCFIPVKPRQEKEAPLLDPPDNESMVPLKNLVNIKSDFAGIGNFLLENTFLADNLEDALKSWNKKIGTLVTLDGDVVTSQGIISGGSKEGINSGILQKKREIKELKKVVSELSGELEDKEKKQKEIINKIATSQSAMEKIVKEIHQGEIRILNLKKDLSQAWENHGRLQRRNEDFDSERKDLLSQSENYKQETKDISKLLKEAIAKKKEGEDFLGRLQEDVAALGEKVGKFREEDTEGRILVASLKEKMGSIDNNLNQLKEFEEDLFKRISFKEKELKETKEELEHLRGLNHKSKIKIEHLMEAHRELERTLSNEKEIYQKKLILMREKEERLRELRKDLSKTSQEVDRLSLELSKLDLDLGHLEDKIEERYQIKLSNTPRPDIKSPNSGKEDDEKKLTRLHTIINNFGEINLMAIDEYQELSKRYEFLTTQQGDLVQSLDSLRNTIAKINQITKKRFKETFEAVNKKFQEIFPILFEGGEGELFLTDETDLLKTGIDVNICPPGKRLKSINLLSKGEKTLAAIALMFSLSLIKPTPFSLLDEVDAALDEANNNRFNEMVKKLSLESQFIIITHNKKTMEISDTLLGVTMENSGVSKLISMKMN